MRSTLLALIGLSAAVLWSPVSAAPVAFVLQDLDSRQTLMSSNASLPVNPGSLVNLMTARALAEIRPEESAETIVKTIREASDALPPDLQKTVGELAVRLGMTRSSFISLKGTADPNQASTATDLAALASDSFLNNRTLLEALTDFGTLPAAASRHRSLFWRESTLFGLVSDGGDNQWSGLIISVNPKSNSSVRRTLAVILNAENAQDLADTAAAMITDVNLSFETLTVISKGDITGSVPVYKGTEKELKVAAAKDAVITLKRSEIADKGADAFTIRMTCRLPVTAPIEEGTELGTLEMLFDGRPVASVPVAAAETVGAGSFWRRVSDTIRLAFNKN